MSLLLFSLNLGASYTRSVSDSGFGVDGASVNVVDGVPDAFARPHRVHIVFPKKQEVVQPTIASQSDLAQGKTYVGVSASCNVVDIATARDFIGVKKFDDDLEIFTLALAA